MTTNVFKNADAEASLAGVTVYTVPANAVIILLGVNLCNKADSQVKVTVKLGNRNISNRLPIPAGASFSPLDGKIVGMPGQVITVSADTAGAIDCILSFLEIS